MAIALLGLMLGGWLRPVDGPRSSLAVPPGVADASPGASPSTASQPSLGEGASLNPGATPTEVLGPVATGSPGPALSVGRANIRTWTDSFGRSRLQVILSVRNDDARWLRFPAGLNTYRILDGTRTLAGGAFTALPARIGPGDTTYLVDTINIPVVELTRSLSAETVVAALPTDAPTVVLTITGLQLTSGIGGGMRAIGRVQNVGAAVTGPVIAGAIALDRDGRPLAAVYDTVDVGRVDPGEARPFATDYEPGAPPVTTATVGEVVGFAFEAD